MAPIQALRARAALVQRSSDKAAQLEALRKMLLAIFLPPISAARSVPASCTTRCAVPGRPRRRLRWLSEGDQATAGLAEFWSMASTRSFTQDMAARMVLTVEVDGLAQLDRLLALVLELRGVAMARRR